jgi:GTPase Era involved in 16S rRNA processing
MAEIRPVRVEHPTDDYPVVFIDTPGFGDPNKSDTEILAMIMWWFMKM